MRTLRHAKVELALHELRAGSGRPLLLLHGLGEHSPQKCPQDLEEWSGSIFGLDFTGHGLSTVPRGGGYTAEVLMGDADTALEEIGPATVVGRGLGAYVALLVAGARAERVRGAILRDGPGMAGGGPRASTPQIAFPNPNAVVPPDPLALIELSRDLRPPDYAASFARQATLGSGLEPAIAVCAVERPEWVDAILSDPGVEAMSIGEALAYYAGAT